MKIVESTELFDNGHVVVAIVLFAALLLAPGSKSLLSIALPLAGYLGAIYSVVQEEESK